ncbi:OmpP1/FadL family transporter [Aeromonas enteropelogenes]|uniref:OmpP1/FadL family transporter n=1 Tax=Aeromonas enteropelogenes TaxID=29489 RepID=UPI0039865BAC
MKRLDSLWSLCLLFTTASQAGGLYLYETGTDDVGLASAGMAARAQDATVQFMNPAGLSRLQGRHLTLGGQALYGDVPYDLADASQQDVDTVVGWFPSASLYYSQQIDDRWTLGFATYGNFGLGLDFGGWAGQQLVKEATLMALTMQPSVAYRIDEHWSLGAAVGLNYGLFALKRETDHGESKLDDSDWAINGKVGVLYELTPATRFGLGYSSEIKYHFDVQTQITLQRPNMPGISAQLPISGMVNSPQQLMLSGYHELAPDWALMGNLGWQDWSRYNGNDVSIVGVSKGNKGLFQDTYHVAVGLQHTLTPQWVLNGGLAYDSSVYKDQDKTSLTIPSGAAVRIGFGARYALNPGESIGAAMEYIDQESANVQADYLSGSYDNPSFYFFAVNYSKQF